LAWLLRFAGFFAMPADWLIAIQFRRSSSLRGGSMILAAAEAAGGGRPRPCSWSCRVAAFAPSHQVVDADRKIADAPTGGVVDAIGGRAHPRSGRSIMAILSLPEVL
jgi:hypothetical protein